MYGTYKIKLSDAHQWMTDSQNNWECEKDKNTLLVLTKYND